MMSDDDDDGAVVWEGGDYVDDVRDEYRSDDDSTDEQGGAPYYGDVHMGQPDDAAVAAEADSATYCDVPAEVCLPRMLSTELLAVQSLTQEHAPCTAPGTAVLSLRPAQEAAMLVASPTIDGPRGGGFFRYFGEDGVLAGPWPGVLSRFVDAAYLALFPTLQPDDEELEHSLDNRLACWYDIVHKCTAADSSAVTCGAEGSVTLSDGFMNSVLACQHVVKDGAFQRMLGATQDLRSEPSKLDVVAPHNTLVASPCGAGKTLIGLLGVLRAPPYQNGCPCTALYVMVDKSFVISLVKPREGSAVSLPAAVRASDVAQKVVFVLHDTERSLQHTLQQHRLTAVCVSPERMTLPTGDAEPHERLYIVLHTHRSQVFPPMLRKSPCVVISAMTLSPATLGNAEGTDSAHQYRFLHALVRRTILQSQPQATDDFASFLNLHCDVGDVAAKRRLSTVVVDEVHTALNGYKHDFAQAADRGADPVPVMLVSATAPRLFYDDNEQEVGDKAHVRAIAYLLGEGNSLTRIEKLPGYNVGRASSTARTARAEDTFTGHAVHTALARAVRLRCASRPPGVAEVVDAQAQRLDDRTPHNPRPAFRLTMVDVPHEDSFAVQSTRLIMDAVAAVVLRRQRQRSINLVTQPASAPPSCTPQKEAQHAFTANGFVERHGVWPVHDALQRLRDGTMSHAGFTHVLSRAANAVRPFLDARKCACTTRVLIFKHTPAECFTLQQALRTHLEMPLPLGSGRLSLHGTLHGVEVSVIVGQTQRASKGDGQAHMSKCKTVAAFSSDVQLPVERMLVAEACRIVENDPGTVLDSKWTRLMENFTMPQFLKILVVNDAAKEGLDLPPVHGLILASDADRRLTSTYTWLQQILGRARAPEVYTRNNLQWCASDPAVALAVWNAKDEACAAVRVCNGLTRPAGFADPATSGSLVKEETSLYIVQRAPRDPGDADGAEFKRSLLRAFCGDVVCDPSSDDDAEGGAFADEDYVDDARDGYDLAPAARSLSTYDAESVRGARALLESDISGNMPCAQVPIGYLQTRVLCAQSSECVEVPPHAVCALASALLSDMEADADPKREPSRPIADPKSAPDLNRTERRMLYLLRHPNEARKAKVALANTKRACCALFPALTCGDDVDMLVKQAWTNIWPDRTSDRPRRMIEDDAARVQSFVNHVLQHSMEHASAASGTRERAACYVAVTHAMCWTLSLRAAQPKLIFGVPASGEKNRTLVQRFSSEFQTKLARALHVPRTKADVAPDARDAMDRARNYTAFTQRLGDRMRRLRAMLTGTARRSGGADVMASTGGPLIACEPWLEMLFQRPALQVPHDAPPLNGAELVGLAAMAASGEGLRASNILASTGTTLLATGQAPLDLDAADALLRVLLVAIDPGTVTRLDDALWREPGSTRDAAPSSALLSKLRAMPPRRARSIVVPLHEGEAGGGALPRSESPIVSSGIVVALSSLDAFVAPYMLGARVTKGNDDVWRHARATRRVICGSIVPEDVRKWVLSPHAAPAAPDADFKACNYPGCTHIVASHAETLTCPWHDRPLSRVTVQSDSHGSQGDVIDDALQCARLHADDVFLCNDVLLRLVHESSAPLPFDLLDTPWEAAARADDAMGLHAVYRAAVTEQSAKFRAPQQRLYSSMLFPESVSSTALSRASAMMPSAHKGQESEAGKERLDLIVRAAGPENFPLVARKHLRSGDAPCDASRATNPACRAVSWTYQAPCALQMSPYVTRGTCVPIQESVRNTLGSEKTVVPPWSSASAACLLDMYDVEAPATGSMQRLRESAMTLMQTSKLWGIFVGWGREDTIDDAMLRVQVFYCRSLASALCRAALACCTNEPTEQAPVEVHNLLRQLLRQMVYPSGDGLQLHAVHGVVKLTSADTDDAHVTDVALAELARNRLFVNRRPTTKATMQQHEQYEHVFMPLAHFVLRCITAMQEAADHKLTVADCAALREVVQYCPLLNGMYSAPLMTHRDGYVQPLNRSTCIDAMVQRAQSIVTTLQDVLRAKVRHNEAFIHVFAINIDVLSPPSLGIPRAVCWLEPSTPTGNSASTTLPPFMLAVASMWPLAMGTSWHKKPIWDSILAAFGKPLTFQTVQTTQQVSTDDMQVVGRASTRAKMMLASHVPLHRLSGLARDLMQSASSTTGTKRKAGKFQRGSRGAGPSSDKRGKTGGSADPRNTGRPSGGGSLGNNDVHDVLSGFRGNTAGAASLTRSIHNAWVLQVQHNKSIPHVDLPILIMESARRKGESRVAVVGMVRALWDMYEPTHNLRNACKQYAEMLTGGTVVPQVRFDKMNYVNVDNPANRDFIVGCNIMLRPDVLRAGLLVMQKIIQSHQARVYWILKQDMYVRKGDIVEVDGNWVVHNEDVKIKPTDCATAMASGYSPCTAPVGYHPPVVFESMHVQSDEYMSSIYSDAQRGARTMHMWVSMPSTEWRAATATLAFYTWAYYAEVLLVHLLQPAQPSPLALTFEEMRNNLRTASPEFEFLYLHEAPGAILLSTCVENILKDVYFADGSAWDRLGHHFSPELKAQRQSLERSYPNGVDKETMMQRYRELI